MTSKLVLPFLLINILMLGSANTLAQSCTATPAYQPDATRPKLTGRLVYHSYKSYGDGTSKLYLFDFQTSKLLMLSSGWGITDPMNAIFSPDGRWITFMGVQKNQWDVFLWQVGSTALPTNLTAALGNHRNEDPRFSFDGKKIAFKQDGDIAIATIDISRSPPLITAVQNVTKDGFKIEESMPYMTPSGKYVIYTRGARSSLEIYRTNLLTNATQKMSGITGVADYYPVVRDSSAYFHTRWNNAVNQLDQIYMDVPNLGSSTLLKANHCASNNSDAAPVDEDLLIFSGTREGASYKLYLGEISSGNVWRLNALGINSMGNNVLGASYSYAR